MPLNKSKGNMYPFITHTFNVIKGECPHGCSYCYMKRFGKQPPLHFDERELKTDLGSGNFIFVGSSCDMFAKDMPYTWVRQVLNRCNTFDNKYLFQTKNPSGFYPCGVNGLFPRKSVYCVTLETNRHIPQIMGNSPYPETRAETFSSFDIKNGWATIEPVLDFDLDKFLEMIKRCNVSQVNIGADSGGNNLPEPPKEKILELIAELEKFTTVARKKNLKRLIK